MAGEACILAFFERAGSTSRAPSRKELINYPTHQYN
jgi:hypothetical protein